MAKQLLDISPFGGIDLDNEPGTLGIRSGDMQNIRLDLKRGIQTITGYSKWNTNQLDSGVAITGIFDYTKKNLTQKIIVGTLEKLYYGAAGAGAYTSFKDSLTGSTGDWWSFAVLNDLLVSANGKDPLQYWNGATAATYQVTGNQWLTRTSLATARTEAVGFYVNGYGYVVGGRATAQLASTEQYDTVSDIN